MKTNQKYTQEEMYIAIELWEESNLSQSEFCKREGLSYHIFLYWLKKYRKEKVNIQTQTFIPVEVTRNNNSIQYLSEALTINYPNGVQVQCPVQMNIEQLRILINI